MVIRGRIYKTLRKMCKKVLEFLKLILISLPALGHAHADDEITNYRSGISLYWDGERGTDYAEEYLYFDKIISDRKVIYIKDDTLISMEHNSRNIAGAASGSDNYESVSENVGVIRYKVDGDQHWEVYPAEWHAYSGAIAFRDLDYSIFGDNELKVVGTVGSNGVELNMANKGAHYYRGVLDSIGDEWHTITVADDDSSYAGGDAEFDSSDGKIYHFVVNPKTPCLTWRATDSAEFYTTPCRKYFIPKIYDQTTYIDPTSQGSITVEIRDINGNNVFYRVNGGNFINAGNSFAVLDDTVFDTGSNLLEYYYEGNESYIKSREVVKNPAYPSEGEGHGDRFWVDAEHWENEVKPRVGKTGTLARAWLDNWRGSDRWNWQSTIVASSRKGLRVGSSGWVASPNAIVARWEGMNAKKSGASHTYADIAKLWLFEIPTTLDPIGLELNHSNSPVPARELYYRGYRDVDGFMDRLIAYDILIGHYRRDQGHSNGVSAIEDYFIRDMFGYFMHMNLMSQAGYFSRGRDDFDSGGMWETSMRVGALMATIMMPSYSTEYFGTSGMDGNQTTYADCPFPDQQYTWKELHLDNVPTLQGFPNVHKFFGVEEYLLTNGVSGYSDGHWVDKMGYTSTINCGHVLGIHGVLSAMWGGGDIPMTNFNKMLSYAGDGELLAVKEQGGPSFVPLAAAQNSYFPDFRSSAQSRMLSTASNRDESLDKQLLRGGPLYVLWYDAELPVASHSSAGGGGEPPVSPDGLSIANE